MPSSRSARPPGGLPGVARGTRRHPPQRENRRPGGDRAHVATVGRERRRVGPPAAARAAEPAPEPHRRRRRSPCTGGARGLFRWRLPLPHLGAVAKVFAPSRSDRGLSPFRAEELIRTGPSRPRSRRSRRRSLRPSRPRSHRGADGRAGRGGGVRPRAAAPRSARSVLRRAALRPLRPHWSRRPAAQRPQAAPRLGASRRLGVISGGPAPRAQVRCVPARFWLTLKSGIRLGEELHART